MSKIKSLAQSKSNNQLKYKIISLITGTVGLLGLVYILLLFSGNNSDSSLIIPVGIIIAIALPIAYTTNKLGRR